MRIVIKIGTSTLAYATGHLNIRRFEELCKVISDIKNSGHEIVIVTSGAIGMGKAKLSIKDKPTDMPTKQAAAAVGQCELMYVYDKYFSEYGHTVGQILLTKSDFESEARSLNFKNTLGRLIDLGAIPIINENDSVATEEIAVGDNDTLASLVAKEAGAKLLVLLSDIDGLYTADPKADGSAKLIPFVSEISEEIEKIAGGAGSTLGTGGMHTKIAAAKVCLSSGIDMVIVNGDDPDRLYDVIDGKNVGTRFSEKKI